MLFDLTITTYIENLTNLRKILDKAKAHQISKKISDETMMNARLVLDQFSFQQQIRAVTNFAKGTGSALCDIPAPVFSDDEKTIEDLQKRIDTVVEFLSSLTQEMVKNDLQTRLIALPWMPGKGLTAEYYASSYALKNFYFHFVTAYSILRHYGVDIGKGDYMSADLKDLA